MATDDFYKHCLSRELATRCERNARYSMRSFAQSLDLNPGALSQILSGKRVPSVKVAYRLLGKLDLVPADRQKFLASLARTHQARGLKRMSPVFRSTPPAGAVVTSVELSQDEFRVISDWYHYAILELTFTEGFKAEPAWIAQRLKISQPEAKLALERLLAMGLLAVRAGKVVKARDFVTTADKNVTGSGYRRRQRQILEKAIVSLENDPIEIRDMSTITMPVDPTLLPEARKMITEFRRKLCKFLESGNNKEVYELGISLFPVSVTKKEEKRK